MKNSIEGFSQQYAATLKTVVTDSKGKSKTIKIDCTDIVILRWFVDFFPNMKKMVVNGREYAWLSHKKLQEDMPILDITKRSCIDRMQKLVLFGILDYTLVKEGGTFSLYSFGKNYEKLVKSNNNGMQSTDIGGMQSNSIGVCGQLHNKDSNTINKSIKNNTRKKESTYDDILSNSVSDLSLIETYKEYIKMRKLIKAPMTDMALQMLIEKVDRLEPESVERKKQMLETAIMNNWKSVYPLKEEAKKPEKQNKESEFDSFMNKLKDQL